MNEPSLVLSTRKPLSPEMHGMSSYQKRQYCMQKLAERAGIDKLALCAKDEDLTIHEELNTEILTQPKPWFEQLKEKEIDLLFNERHTRHHLTRQLDEFSQLFDEEKHLSKNQKRRLKVKRQRVNSGSKNQSGGRDMQRLSFQQSRDCNQNDEKSEEDLIRDFKNEIGRQKSKKSSFNEFINNYERAQDYCSGLVLDTFRQTA